MTFQEEEKNQLTQFLSRIFILRTTALHEYLLCGDLSSALLVTIPHPSSLTPIACTQHNSNSNQQKNQLKFEITVFTKPKPSRYRHPKIAAIFDTIQLSTFESKSANTHPRTHTYMKHNFAPGEILAPEVVDLHCTAGVE